MHELLSRKGENRWGRAWRPALAGVCLLLGWAAAHAAPTANPDTYNTPVSAPLTVGAPGVLGNDTAAAPADLPLTVLKDTDPPHGTLTLNADGSFTYVPVAGYHGFDTFKYRAKDNNNAKSAQCTDTFIDDSPATVVNDTYATVMNTPLTVAGPGVLANDTDIDGDALTAALVTGAAHGTVALNANGSFTYTPNAGWFGTDSFTYLANDTFLNSAIATVSIKVDAPPVAVADGPYFGNTGVMIAVAAPGVRANDTDADGDPLTAVKVTDPLHGTLVLNANGSFTFTPQAGWHGTDSFTYKANDGLADSNIVTVALISDTAPVAGANAYTTLENTNLTVAAPGVMGNDTDADGDPLTAILLAPPAHGVLTLNPDGSFNYAPDADYKGPDAFTYKVNDGFRDSNIVTVNITVLPVSPWPAFGHDAAHSGKATTKLLATPKLQWSFLMPGAYWGNGDNPVHGAPSISPDATRAFLGSNDGNLWAFYLQNTLVYPDQLSPSSGRVTPFSGTPLVVDDGLAGYTVYAANADGRVYWQHLQPDNTVDWAGYGAVPAAGARPWAPLVGSPTRAVTVDGTTWVIVVAGDGTVYKINHATKAWAQVCATGASIEASPAIDAPWTATFPLTINGAAGTTAVYLDTTNVGFIQVGDAIGITDAGSGFSQALGTVTGTTVAGQVTFTVPLAAAFTGITSHITLRRTALCIGDQAGAVYSVNLESGTLRWTARFAGAAGRTGGFSASPLITGGYVYLGDRGGLFLQLNEATGAASVIPTLGAKGAFTTACQFNDLANAKIWLYVGCAEANGLVKIDASVPTAIPPATMVTNGIASALLAQPASGYVQDKTTDPRLVLGGKDGTVYVLKDNESVVGTWKLPAYQETLRSTVVPVTKTAYVLAFADGLVCYLTDAGTATPPTKLPQSSWPQFQHDPIHTGAPAARDERYAAPSDISGPAFDTTKLRWAVNTGGAVASTPAQARVPDNPRNNRQNPAGLTVPLVSMNQGEQTLLFGASIAGIFYVGDPLIIGTDYLGPITAISADKKTVTVTYAAAATYDATALVEVSPLRVDRLQNLVDVYTGDTKVLCTAPERFLPGDVVKITDLSNAANTAYLTIDHFLGDFFVLPAGQTVGIRILKANGYLLEAGLFYGTSTGSHRAAWLTTVGSDDGVLRAIDPESGTVIWRNDVEQYLGAVRGAPAVDSIRGRLYVTALTGRLLAFAMNGQFLWAYPSLDTTPLGPIVSAPVLEDDVNSADVGMVYVGGDDGTVYKLTPNGDLALRADGTTPCKFTPAVASPLVGGLALYRLEPTINITDPDAVGLPVPARRVVVALRGDPTNGGKVYLLDRELKSVLTYPDNVPTAQGKPTVGTLTAEPVTARRGDPANAGKFVTVVALGDNAGRFHAFYENVGGLGGGAETLNKLWVLQTDAALPIAHAAATVYDQGLPRPAPNAAKPWHDTYYFGDSGGTLYTVLDTDADATEAHIEAGFALDGALAAPLTVDGQGMVLASTDHGNVYSLLPESQSYGWTYPWSFGSPLIKNAVKSSWTATPPAGRGFTAGSPYTVTARLFPHFTADGQRVDFGFSLDNVPTPYAYLSVVRQSSGAVYFELTDLSNPATPQVVPGATLPFAVGRSWDDGVEVQFAYSGNWFDAVAGTYTIWFDAYARVADSHGVFTGGFTNVGSLGITAAALPGTLLPFTRSLDPNVTTLRLDGCTTYQWYAGGTAPGPYVNWQWNVAADGKRSRALPIRTAPTPWLGDVLAVGGDDGTVYGIGPRGEQWNAAPQPDTRTTQISSPWALFHREPRRQGSTDLAGLSEAGPYSPSLRWLQPHNNIIINSSPVVSDRGADRVTRVYAGTDDGKLYAHEALTGAPILAPAWGTSNTDGSIVLSIDGVTSSDAMVRATPAVHTDGTLAVGALDGRLYVYNYKGALQWYSSKADAKVRGNFLASPIFAGLGTDYLVYAATCDSLTTGGKYAIDDGTTKTPLGAITTVTLNAGYALVYTIDSAAAASEYWVSYVRVRTMQGGQLQYQQNGAWIPYAAYPAATTTRYITMALNRLASAVKWVNTDTVTATVTGMEVYTAGKVGTPATIGTPGTAGDPLLQFTPTQPTLAAPVTNPDTTAASPVTIADQAGNLFWAYRVRVRSALAYTVKAEDPNGLWRVVKSVAAKADPTTGKPADIPEDVINIDRTVLALRWERQTVGETYTDVNANGKWDPGEPYVDANGNGKYDASLDARATNLYEFDPDVRLMTLNSGGRVYAFASDGTVKWAYPPADQPAMAPVTSSPALTGTATNGDAMLYVATADGRVLGLAHDGVAAAPTIAWTQYLYDPISAPLTVVANPGGGALSTGTEANDLYLLDLNDGGRPMAGWPVPGPGPVTNASAITADGQAFMPTQSGQLLQQTLYGRKYPDAALTATAPQDIVPDVRYDVNPRYVAFVGHFTPNFGTPTGNKYLHFWLANGATPYDVRLTDAGQLRCEPFGATPLTTTALVPGGLAALTPFGIELTLTLEPVLWSDGGTRTRVTGYYRMPDAIGNFTGAYQQINSYVDTAASLTNLYPFVELAPDGDATVTAAATRLTVYQGYHPVTATATDLAPLVTQLLDVQSTVHSSPAIDAQGNLFFGTDNGNLVCVDTLKGALLWSYLPDRGLIATALYTDVIEGTTRLPVTSVTGFTPGDVVQITRPDGSRPETLGTVTAIERPVNVPSTTLAQATDAPVLTKVLHLTDITQVMAGDSISCLPTYNPTTQVAQALRALGNVVSVDTVAQTVTLDTLVPLIDLDGDGTATDPIPAGSPVYITRGYGYLDVSVGPNYKRSAGDIVSSQRGSALPMRTAPSVGKGQLLYIAADDGVLYAIGPSDRAIVPPALPPLIDADQVSPWYTFHRDNLRTGFAAPPGPVSRVLRWYTDTGSTLESSPSLGYADAANPLGMLYQGTGDETDTNGIVRQRGALLAYNASNGTLRWRQDDNQNMGRVLTTPSVYVTTRLNALGVGIRDEFITFGTVDAPDGAQANLQAVMMADSTIITPNGAIPNTAPTKYYGQYVEIPSTQPVIGVRVTGGQVSDFTVGQDIFITSSAGTMFEFLGNITAINYDTTSGQWWLVLDPGSTHKLRGGESYTDTNGNGQWDVGEAFVDANGNGVYDPGHVLYSSFVSSHPSQEGHLYCVDREGTIRWRYPNSGQLTGDVTAANSARAQSIDQLQRLVNAAINFTTAPANTDLFPPYATWQKVLTAAPYNLAPYSLTKASLLQPLNALPYIYNQAIAGTDITKIQYPSSVPVFWESQPDPANQRVVAYADGHVAVVTVGATQTVHIAPVHASPVIDQEGTSYFATDDGVVYAVDIDGYLKWQYNVPAMDDTEATLQTLAAPSLDSTSARLFVSVSAPDANRGYVLALDTQTSSDDKRLLWRRRFGVPYTGEVVDRLNATELASEAGGPVTASPTVSTANGFDRIYIGTDNFNGTTGAFYSLDVTTGNIVNSVTSWPAMQEQIMPLPMGPISSTAAAISEQSAATYHITGITVNAATTTLTLREGNIGLKVAGRVRIYPPRGVINANITDVAGNKTDITVDQVLPATVTKLTTDEQCVLVGSQDGRLYAMTENLDPLWYFGTSGPILTSPAISTQLSNSIQAPTPTAGTPVAMLTSGGTFNGIGSVTYTVRITAGDPTNPNAFTWSDDGWVTTHGPTDINPGAPIALSLGVTITFAQRTGFTTGNAWSFTASSTGDRTYQAYIGSNNHLVYAIDFYGSSHNLVWSRDVRDRVFASPIVGMRPSDASPAVVYQPSRDHYMYAFGDQLQYDGDTINPDTGPTDTYVPPDEPNPNDPYAMKVPSKPTVRKMVEQLTCEPFIDVNGNGKWDPGEPFLDLNGNGQWDINEPYSDVNGNGAYDVGEPFTDVNGNGVRDSFNEVGNSWWRLVVTVNNAGRGIIDHVKVSDVLPVPLVAPGNSIRPESSTIYTPTMLQLGLGRDDMSTLGWYTGPTVMDFRVQAVAGGAQDQFTWWASTDGLEWTDPNKVWNPAAGVTLNMAAYPQCTALTNGVYVRFLAPTGHTGKELWYFRAEPYVSVITTPTDPTSQSYEIDWYADAAKNGFSFLPDLKDITQPRHQVQQQFVFYVQVPEGTPKRDFSITSVTAAGNNATTVTVASTAFLSTGLIVTVCNTTHPPVDVYVVSVDSPTTFTAGDPVTQVATPINSDLGAVVKLTVRYKVTSNGNVMTTSAPDTNTNVVSNRRLMDRLYLQLFQHPIAQLDLGTQNKNQVTVAYYTYNREVTIDTRPPERAETKVDNSWSSTGDAQVRFYYNGWEATDALKNIRLATFAGMDTTGSERRAFSPWNELEPDDGIPYSFSPITKMSFLLWNNYMYPDGMAIPDQRQIFRKQAQGTATSGFLTQLYPRVSRYDLNALNRGRVETFTPYAWRSTIRPVWRQVGARPPMYILGSLPFDERIRIAVVAAGGGGATVTTLNVVDASRVKVGHRIVIDNPDGNLDAETYVSAVVGNTITVNPAVAAQDNAIVRDEWSPDFVIQNPITVTDTSTIPVPLTGVPLGSMAAPGNTTTSSPLRITSLVSFPGGDNSPYRNPWSIQYRFMSKAVDLRGPTPVAERLAKVTDDSMAARAVITVDTPATFHLFDSVRIVNPWPVPSVEAVVVGINTPGAGQLTLSQKAVINQDAVIYRTAPDWNALLEAISAYSLGATPTAGLNWDGFRYDPYDEHYVSLTQDALDRPIGPVLLNGRHVDLHITRTVPAHQAASVVGAVSDAYATFRDTQTVYYDDLDNSGGWNTGEPIYILINGTRLNIEDINNNGQWDPGEPLYYDVNGNGVHDPGEPYVTPGVFDLRVFVDMNGNHAWDPGEPYYIVMPNTTPDYAAWDGSQSPRVMETNMSVAPVTRTLAVNTVTDIGRMPSMAGYGLPAAAPTMANDGNTSLVPDGTQPTLAASSVLSVTAGAYIYVQPRLGAIDPHELLRTGTSAARYDKNTDTIIWRAGTEIQPLPYSRYFDPAWRLPKSPAGASTPFARPYSAPWPSDITTLLRQPTGTYTGTGTVHLIDGDTPVRTTTDTTTLTMRLGESRLSMVVPPNFAITPPGFDYSRHLDPKARFWTAYLTGTESWPVGLVLPTMRVSANPLEKDDLGVWVCSNTPVPNDTDDRTAYDFTRLLPTPQTDTNIWFRRVKHLVTAPLAIPAQATPLLAGQTKTIAIPKDVWDQVRCIAADAAGVSATTTDLVLIRKKQQPSDAANQPPSWTGYVTRKYYSDPLTGGDGLYRIEAYDPMMGEDIDPTVDNEVDILSHPWVPVVSPNDMTRLRKLLDDPMNPTGGPTPLRFSAPTVTMDGDDVWLAWTVNAVQQVTRIDPSSKTPIVNHIAVAYQVYKHFNANAPWGVTSPAPPVDPTLLPAWLAAWDDPITWIGAPTSVLKADGPTPLPSRATSLLLPCVESSADGGGRTWQGALLMYESGLPTARGLYYARSLGFLATTTTTAAWKPDSPLPLINWAFTNTDKPQLFADSTAAGLAEAPMHNLNLILQGTRADGNTDLYYARLTVRETVNPINDPTEPIIPSLVMQALTTPEADPLTGVLTDTLSSSQGGALYLPGDGLAWLLYYDKDDIDARRIRLDLTGTKAGIGTTYPATLSLKQWIDLPTAQPTGVLPDDNRDLVLDGLMDGKTLRVLFNPYNGTVRILTSPYPITAVKVTGLPRLQRLTSHLAPDVNPIVAVERWHYTNDAGTKVYGNDGTLLARPRIWLYWTRMHDDGLGPRVYARPYRLTPVGGSTVRMNLRMDDSGTTPPDWNHATVTAPSAGTDVTVDSTLGFQSGMRVNIGANIRNEFITVTDGSTLHFTHAVSVNNGDTVQPIIQRFEPDHLLPMEVLSADGSIAIVRQAAPDTPTTLANSPEAGLWVLSTASRDLAPNYPGIDPAVTHHDLFLQVISDPTAD